jgi:hypothetical protein
MIASSAHTITNLSPLSLSSTVNTANPAPYITVWRGQLPCISTTAAEHTCRAGTVESITALHEQRQNGQTNQVNAALDMQTGSMMQACVAALPGCCTPAQCTAQNLWRKNWKWRHCCRCQSLHTCSLFAGKSPCFVTSPWRWITPKLAYLLLNPHLLASLLMHASFAYWVLVA